MTRLRIALVVQGRFHAFDLARGLSARGHDVTLFTTYPRWATSRFDLGGARVTSAWAHGVAARTRPFWAMGQTERADALLHRGFGRWAARALEGESWDVVHCWSGVSEELLRSTRVQARARILMRGSAHIAVQDEILRDEAARVGVPVERPSPWMIDRERREYELADRVLVLSSFARRSFTSRGYPDDRLILLPLGVDTAAFRPSPADLGTRLDRIRRGTPLRVLYVGNLSFQKGLWDLLEAARQLESMPLEFRLVGDAQPECGPILGRATRNVRVLGKVPQTDLPAVYREADVFLFPTLHDGFGVVLTQALAAGLPVIATDHCAAPDLIAEGRDGWIVPVRSPERLVDRLRWCDAHREECATIAETLASTRPPEDWAVVAGRAERLFVETMDAMSNGTDRQ